MRLRAGTRLRPMAERVRGMTATAAWNPGRLPGYQWGIDSASVFTDAGTTQATANGDLIQQANDTSANSRNSTQGTSGTRPQYYLVGGKPTLRFDGSRRLVTPPFLGSAYNTSFTFYLVSEYCDQNALRVAAGFDASNFHGQSVAGRKSQVDSFTGNLASAGSNRYNEIDGINLHIRAVRYNGTTKKIRVVGPGGIDSEVSYTTSGNLGLTGTVTVGDYVSGGFAWRGFIPGSHLYSAHHTDAEVDAMVAYLTARHLGEPSVGTLSSGGGTVNIVCDGNSLTSGTGGTPYPSQLATSLGAGYTVTNIGVAGQTTAAMNLDGESQVDALWSASASRNICVCWESTNSLYYNSGPLTTIRQMRDYVLRRLHRGWEVRLLTTLPRSDAGTPGTFETDRQTVNTALRALTSLSSRVVIADVAADSRIGDAGDELDTTYYSADKVHMNTTGYGVVAGIVAASL